MACFTDITQQKWSAEVELQRTQDALEAKRHHENFIDITSHEIRNPLNNSVQCAEEISSIARARLRENDSNQTAITLLRSEVEDILNAAEVIEQCNMHQRRIVDDILTVSKMKGGMLQFNLSPTKPLVVARNILRMFSREFRHWNVESALVIDPSFEELVSESEWLELDPGRLQQIIINLFTNAIKFTKTQSARLIKLQIGASETLQPLASCKNSCPPPSLVVIFERDSKVKYLFACFSSPLNVTTSLNFPRSYALPAYRSSRDCSNRNGLEAKRDCLHSLPGR